MNPLAGALAGALLLGACSFDYGAAGTGEEQPDITMRQVEYVRVRDGEPAMRFQAELVERYEQRQAMELQNFSFEQFSPHGEEVNARGRAGAASVELDTGNIRLGNGVRIEIEPEDITIETTGLDWRDKERALRGQDDAEVNVTRADGTSFSGRGFSADARRRTWEFSGGVEGVYIHQNREEEPEEPGEEDAGEAETEEGEGEEESPP